MARAKRTDRADARRRYRLAQEGGGYRSQRTRGRHCRTQHAEQWPLGSRRRRPRVATSRPKTPARPNTPPAPRSFTDSLRVAFHRPDVRADIASLPWLLRTRAFLVPLALVVAGVAALVVAPNNPAAGLFFQLFVLPPAMAPIFIAGFFAKRASYLLGLIIAIVDVIGYAIFVYAALPALSADPVSVARQQELLVSALAVGPLSGIVFAAGAAWYRRFLSFSSAQRNRTRGGAAPKPKRVAGRYAGPRGRLTPAPARPARAPTHEESPALAGPPQSRSTPSFQRRMTACSRSQPRIETVAVSSASSAPASGGSPIQRAPGSGARARGRSTACHPGFREPPRSRDRPAPRQPRSSRRPQGRPSRCDQAGRSPRMSAVVRPSSAP